MNKLGEQVSRALRPDAQAFDEVRITTVPRYKMSGMSGDEWRISGKIELFRKGRLICEDHYRDVETCARFLPIVMARAIDDGKAFYAGEEDFCDQEGCADKATVILRQHKGHCRSCGQSSAYDDYDARNAVVIRKFCARHSRRGDCGIDDADRNYEVVAGQVGVPKDSDMSESARVVIPVKSIEEIPGAAADFIKSNERNEPK